MGDRLTGKIALITGGTSGIGQAIVKEFLDQGAHVLFVGRNQNKAEQMLRQFNGSTRGSKLFFYPTDYSNLSTINDLLTSISEKFSVIDILVNCAGIWRTYQLPEITEEAYRETMDVNFGSCVFMTQKFLPMIREHGSIINVASIGGLQSHIAGRSQYLYAASKAAMVEFSQLCALNYAEKVRVNCICPGPTDTPIYENRHFEKIIDSIPMKRMGVPEDAAKAAAFLASDDASYINGAVLTIDGGASLT